jgi:hypothetical protein
MHITDNTFEASLLDKQKPGDARCQDYCALTSILETPGASQKVPLVAQASST